MRKIKTVYIAIFLIVSLALGFLVAVPEVIPSWEIVQHIVVFIIYLASIVFAYTVIVRLRKFIHEHYQKLLASVITTFMALFFVGGLFFAFLITSLSVGQGFMGGTMTKELQYPKHNVTLYLYDDSLLDPLTTIKIKKKAWPIMEDLVTIENCQPSDLTIWRHDDVVEFSYNNIEVRVYLITRKAQKIYLKE